MYDLKEILKDKKYIKEVESFPHYRHNKKGIEASTERNLEDVFEYIKKIFFPKPRRSVKK